MGIGSMGKAALVLVVLGLAALACAAPVGEEHLLDDAAAAAELSLGESVDETVKKCSHNKDCPGTKCTGRKGMSIPKGKTSCAYCPGLNKKCVTKGTKKKKGPKLNLQKCEGLLGECRTQLGRSARHHLKSPKAKNVPKRVGESKGLPGSLAHCMGLVQSCRKQLKKSADRLDKASALQMKPIQKAGIKKAPKKVKGKLKKKAKKKAPKKKKKKAK